MSWPDLPQPVGASTEIGVFEERNPPLIPLLVALLCIIVGFVCTLMFAGGGDIVGYGFALLAFVALLAFRHFDGKAREVSVVRVITGLDAGVMLLMVATIVLMTISRWPIATEISRNF